VPALHPDIVAPFTAVVTPRLSIQPLGRDDLDEFAVLCARAELWEFEQGRGLTRSQTEEYLDRQMNLWAEHGFGACGVWSSEGRHLIGIVGLAVPVSFEELLPTVTIGWRFSPAQWGKGYATEAATAVLRQAFVAMGLERVGCVTHSENRRSLAVTQRLGMTIVSSPSHSETAPSLVFHITREKWLAQCEASWQAIDRFAPCARRYRAGRQCPM
jgi:RimJ/RimL family protein N-acetyltransferase